MNFYFFHFLIVEKLRQQTEKKLARVKTSGLNEPELWVLRQPKAPFESINQSINQSYNKKKKRKTPGLRAEILPIYNEARGISFRMVKTQQIVTRLKECTDRDLSPASLVVHSGPPGITEDINFLNAIDSTGHCTTGNRVYLITSSQFEHYVGETNRKTKRSNDMSST